MGELFDCTLADPPAEVMADRDSIGFKKDLQARTKLIFSLDESLLKYIRGASTAHQVWTKLCFNFEDKGVRRRAILLRKLVALRQDKALDRYVLEFRETVNLIAETGKPLEDELTAILLLSGVKAEHQAFCQIVERTCVMRTEDGSTTLQFDTIAEELLREGTRIRSEEPPSKGALKASGKPFRSRSASTSGREQHQGGGTSHRSSPTRWQHGSGGSQPQHSRRPQTWWNNINNNQQTTQTRQQNQPRSAGPVRGRGTFPICSYCKRDNHPESKCYFKPKQNMRRDDQDDFKVKKPRHSSDNDSQNRGPHIWKLKIAKRPSDKDPDNADSKILKLDQSKNVNECQNKNKCLEFYIDSGAFKTICNDKTCLHDYREVNSESIECAGDQVLYTEGIGELKLNELKHNGLAGIEDVTYVPNLTCSLLSVSSIAKSGYVTLFKDNHCGIYHKNDVSIRGNPLLETYEKNGTYKLNLETKVNNVALKAGNTRSTQNIWHRRFAHLGTNSLSLLENGLVDGISKLQDKRHDPCETCCKSKQIRAPLPRDEAQRGSDLLEIIHSDVCEVTDCQSWEGYKYFVTFTDDKTRYTVVALLKTKNEVFQKFKEYKAIVEKHTGKQIKILRSDNGTEYCNAEFEEYLKKEGIIRQLSVVDTPEQNGVSERVNRTLLEKVRAMLKEAGLDFRYWAVALLMAVYLKNLSPTKAVPGQVPAHAWTGQKPNVENLRVFGCLAFVHINRKKTKKLRDRSKICIFMGYDDEKKGFKLMDIDQPKRYFVERSVVFDENRFPAIEAKQKNSEIQGEDSENIPDIPFLKIKETGTQPSLSKNKEAEAQSVDDTWEEYSSTSISRLSNDQVSSCGEDTSGSRSIIDIENISTVSDTESFKNISKRVRKPRQFPDFEVYGTKKSNANAICLASAVNPHIPGTIQEALACPEANFWIKAMEDELESFENCKVWSLETPQANIKIVGNKWVFKQKTNKDGSILYRARLVAKGYTQTYGVDYFETFAPVVRRSTLRLLFSVAVNLDLKIDHLDVKTAFLHGDLSETVYMSQPEGFAAVGLENKVCRLHKAMYGLKQAARSWNLKADKVLKEQGFVNFNDEPCVYLRNYEASIVIIALYVDDFYLLYKRNSDKIALLNTLQSRFKIKDLGEAKNCLGIKLIRNWEEGTLLLNQEDYVYSILSKFNMQDSNEIKTPMEYKLKLRDLNEGEKCEVPYQELIGCLLYLSVNTRPDIAYAVSFLSQYNTNYTSTHWKLAKRLLAYLKSTSKLGLKYVKIPHPSFCLIGYADADWAGNPADYKSYSGYCFTLDGNLISWESKKQKLAAQSSTESEYISLTEAVKESLYLNDLINDFFKCGPQKVTIFNDNLSTIRLAYSSNFSARTKHFGCRMQLVRDCVRDGSICLEHMSTELMPADVLTKGLGKLKHDSCCERLGMFSD